MLWCFAVLRYSCDRLPAYTARHVPYTGGSFSSVANGLWQWRSGSSDGSRVLEWGRISRCNFPSPPLSFPSPSLPPFSPSFPLPLRLPPFPPFLLPSSSPLPPPFHFLPSPRKRGSGGCDPGNILGFYIAVGEFKSVLETRKSVSGEQFYPYSSMSSRH